MGADLNQAQLDALVAIADSGSFEAAARALHVTPSAVSQRIRALEAAAGQVLVSRGAPCRPTGHGERLVQLGRQTRLLYDEARRELGTLAAVELPVAVNADSLATWFRGGDHRDGRLGGHRRPAARGGSGVLPGTAAPRRGAGGGDQ